MPSHRSFRQALARLHNMAGLGIQGPQLIAPVLQMLHQLVAFDSGGYVHPSSDGLLQTYLEHPEIQAREADYFDPHILRNEGQVFHCSLRHLGQRARIGHGPLLLEQLLKVPYTGLLRSDFYNVLLRSSGVTDWVTLVLRADQGQQVGTLILYRSAGSPSFTRDELAVLAQLEAHLAHVLKPGNLDAQDSEDLTSGLLIATDKGRLQWLSPEAETLMQQAFSWHWRGSTGTLPEQLQELLRRLHAPALPGESLALPQMQLCNARGWFVLRATRMAAATGRGVGREVVALHITRRVARGPRLLSALHALGLPPRQQELAWWVARGLSESQIAERMGISVNTVVYHRRQIYNRLGLLRRQELLDRLHQGASTSNT